MLLELLQSPQESLESIANELDITLAALTIYLATDDAATIFAQADFANARRARTAAAAQLEKCIGALSLIIDDFVSDITHNLQRETPKSRREQDRQKETTRRAATLLYRIANFTPKALTVPAPTPRPAPNAPPLPAKRGEVPESARAVRGREAHRPPAKSLSTANLPASTSPERERVGASAFTSTIRNPTSDIPASTNPACKRGVIDALIAPPPLEDQSLAQPAALVPP